MKTAFVCLLFTVLVTLEIRGEGSDSLNAAVDRTLAKATSDSMAFEKVVRRLDSLESAVTESVDSYPYWRSLLINIIAGVIVFLAGIYFEELKALIRRPLVRKFWGRHVFDSSICVVYGALQDLRVQGPTAKLENRYVKHFPDGVSQPLIGPWQDIISTCEVRAASYIINALSKFRRNPIPIVGDAPAIADLKFTAVSFGSPFSNALSKLIMEEETNKFVEFAKDGPFIIDKTTGSTYTISGSVLRRDHGVILKLKNSRFKEHFLFVCAGIGEWGTSGAAWYLANNWKDLLARGDEFAAIVEVTIGSDSSAREVRSAMNNRETNTDNGNEAKSPMTGSNPPVFTLQDAKVIQKPGYVDSTNIHDSNVFSSSAIQDAPITAYNHHTTLKRTPKRIDIRKPRKRKGK